MFPSQRSFATSMYAEELAALRRGALMTGIAAVTLTLTSREAVRLYIPFLGKAVIVVFLLAGTIASVLAAVAFAELVRDFARRLRRAAVLCIGLSAIATMVIMPVALVFLLGQSQSASWYVVFYAFLPNGLLTAAQLTLASGSSTATRLDRPLASCAILALPGAAASPLILIAALFNGSSVLGSVGVMCALLVSACNVVILGRSTFLLRRTPPPLMAQGNRAEAP